jgi:ankyrin repeat protein
MNAYELINGLHKNYNETIEWLSNNRGEIDLKTNIGETALHYCAIENNFEIVKTLIEMGANINYTEEFGASPLMNSIKLGNYEMALLLLKHNADVDIKDVNGGTALSYCVLKDNTSLFDDIYKNCKKDLQFYFDSVDAMMICENPDNGLKKRVIGMGLINPYDA